MTAPILEASQEIDGFTVVKFIDAGGNGEVWEVAAPDGKRAAMKILRNRRADSVAYQRFRREIETVRGLGSRVGVLPILHAHIPETPTRKDRARYVMPLAVPLDQALQGATVLEVVSALATLAETLADLHSDGVGHRDIKPANLLWHEGVPTLGDFGLVALPDAESLTEPGRVPGAFGYIANEVMQSPDTADAAPADVFGLAKVLWKLLVPESLYPPQGPLSANSGPSTLARNLTVAHADALDRILESATRDLPARIDMPTFARELRGWTSLPEPVPLPDGLAATIAAARQAMSSSLDARDAATARKKLTQVMEGLLVQRADLLFEAVRSIDPAGARTGRMAIGPLNRLIEQPAELGRPSYGPAFHYGIRVTRTEPFGAEDVLIVAFCLQVTDEDLAEGAISGLLLAGDERTNDNVSRRLPTRRARLGVELEGEIELAVADAHTHLTEVLNSFIARAAR